ncbi:ABC transporter substrate-binding protein [Synechococcus elongatus]|uniref:ABC transporter substrate-binding protein n=1 Tax=Synechococcus elongatus TaxID=32046 RepID=UPI000F7EC53D|nr:ABC transporter substrate-binding protein [Synechococcus elongatus]
MPWRSWFVISLRRWLAFCLAAVLLVACGRASAPPRQQLIASVRFDPKTFNYALNEESPNVFGLLYEGLVHVNGFDGSLEPGLAESWQISPDRLQVIFQLRPDLRWSDGQPLTAADVDFTYNRIYFNPKVPTGARDILRIDQDLPTVRAAGDRQVIVQTPRPFAPLLRNMALPILPQHALATSLEQTDSQGNPAFLSTWGTETDPKQIIVNGPFRLQRYQPGQRIIFERNPYFYQRDRDGSPLPKIDRLVWQIVENSDTQLLQFRSGDLDVLEPIQPGDFSLLKREEQRGNFTIYSGGPEPLTVYLTFNLNQGRRKGKPLVDPIKSAWFNDVRFRQAIAYAIDRPAIVDTAYRGLGVVVNSLIIPQSPFYLSPEEGLPVYNFNQQKAEALLKEAGFQTDAEGQLRDRQGNPVRFTVITNAENPVRVAMGARIKGDLARLGIQVDFTPIAFSSVIDRLSNQLDWEGLILGLTSNIEPNSGANVWNPQGSLHLFNQQPSESQAPIEGQQVAPWEAEIYRLFVAAAQELNDDRRKEIYGQAQRLAQQYLPFIYLVNRQQIAAVRNTVTPIQFSELGGALWNTEFVSVSADD